MSSLNNHLTLEANRAERVGFSPATDPKLQYSLIDVYSDRHPNYGQIS